jgi:hypothetical protein
MALASGTKLGPYDIQSLLGRRCAYSCVYTQWLSQVYVVRGMK